MPMKIVGSGWSSAIIVNGTNFLNNLSFERFIKLREAYLVSDHSHQIFYKYAILIHQKTYFIILTHNFTIHCSSHLLIFNSI